MLYFLAFLLYSEYIAMISSRSDGRVRRAIASEVVDLGIVPSPVKPKTQKLVSTASGVRRIFQWKGVSVTSYRDDVKILRHHDVTSLAVSI